MLQNCPPSADGREQSSRLGHVLTAGMLISAGSLVACFHKEIAEKVGTVKAGVREKASRLGNAAQESNTVQMIAFYEELRRASPAEYHDATKKLLDLHFAIQSAKFQQGSDGLDHVQTQEAAAQGLKIAREAIAHCTQEKNTSAGARYCQDALRAMKGVAWNEENPYEAHQNLFAQWQAFDRIAGMQNFMQNEDFVLRLAQNPQQVQEVENMTKEYQKTLAAEGYTDDSEIDPQLRERYRAAMAKRKE